MRNRILFMEWKSFGNIHIKQTFEQLGYDVENYLFDTDKINTVNDEQYTGQLARHIIKTPYYGVFSFNYYPVVAIACKACRVPYISWTYDSPFIQIYSKTIEYDTNFPFIFDRKVCENLESKGIRTYYLPMAAPTDCYQSVLSKNKSLASKYRGELSFVGSLYSEAHGNLFRYLDKLKPYEKGYVDALIAAQKRVYGYNFLEEVLRDRPEIMREIQKICPVYANGDGLETAEWTLANYFLDRKITSIERREILELLGERYKVKLYTPSSIQMQGIENCGKVDYYEEAPIVFANSKINLNISLRSIQSGIPLRAFDIMACGGFLISNYQEDFLEYFIPDQDIVIYNDYGDLLEKVGFYLKNEKSREQIAENGHQKVMREHTYLQRVKYILEIVDEYWR